MSEIMFKLKPLNSQTFCQSLILSLNTEINRTNWSRVCPASCVPAEEDRRGRVRGDLRGLGPADAGERGAEGGVGPAAQTGAEDGGGGAEEAAGWGRPHLTPTLKHI